MSPSPVPPAVQGAIGVILVDYRSDPDLAQALQALAEDRSALLLSVVVVQNCPTAAPPRVPAGLSVRFLRSEKNLGFGRAVNQARRHLQTPYFLTLNPDTWLAPDALGLLHRHMETHPDVGVVVPRLFDAVGQLQFSVRTFYDLPTLLLRRTPLGRLLPNHPRLVRHLMSDWDHADLREVDWALGACMLIRATAVPDEIFDPRFFLYFEDVDLCLRLKRAGWKTVYHPSATARHAHRQESRRRFWGRAHFAHIQSGVQFVVKHKGFGASIPPFK